MLRFIKHTLTSIDGVAIFPVFSLLLFTLFFGFITYLVIRMRKEQVDKLSNLPLDIDETKQMIQNEK